MQRFLTHFGKLSMAQRRRLLLLGVPAIGLAIGMYFYVQGLAYATTDDAFIKADKVYVATQVSGRLQSLMVHEYERVKAGTLLLQLEGKPFQLALAAADAHLTQVRSDLESLRAQYRMKQAELAQAISNVAYYQRAYERSQRLIKPGFTSKSAFDDVRQRLANARFNVQVVSLALAAVRAKLGEDPQKPVERFSSYRQAAAERDLAELHLQETRVYAPMDAIVGPLPVQPGDFVPQGRALFALMSTRHYVVAHLKETDVGGVKPGQKARVEIDAYPGQVWQATVESISPASGSVFSLLPPENSSGNWVKVVQRITVRLKLQNIADEPPLRSGLSANVRIAIAHPVNWLR